MLGIIFFYNRCIALELIDGEATFRGTNEIEQLDQIYKLLGTPDTKTWPGIANLPWYSLMKPKVQLTRQLKAKYINRLSHQCLDLIDKLLQMDPSKRPTCAQVLKHAYLVDEKPLPCLPEE